MHQEYDSSKMKEIKNADFKEETTKIIKNKDKFVDPEETTKINKKLD